MSKTWMLTQSRRRVEPLNFKAADVWLPDIAASLAKQVRYNGHVDFFYSVAEHSVLISRALERDGQPRHIQATGLLHDSSEAWLGDMIRPMKNALREAGFDPKPYEEDIEKKVSDYFGLPYPWAEIVHEYDARIIDDEKQQLKFDDNTWSADYGLHGTPLGVKIECWEWEKGQREFMFRAQELGLEANRNPFSKTLENEFSERNKYGAENHMQPSDFDDEIPF